MVYFKDVVDRLSGEDRRLLGVLQEQGATAVHNSVTKRDLIVVSELSAAIYRKTLTRLIALRFIDYSAGAKDHVLYITAYGQAALDELLTPTGGTVHTLPPSAVHVTGKGAVWHHGIGNMASGERSER